MSRSAVFVCALATAAVVLSIAPGSAQAQNHYPRQHAVVPLRELVPDSLPAPYIGHPEANKPEKPKRLRDRGTGGYTYKHPGFEAKVGADGRVKFNDINIRANVYLVPPFIFVAGILDVSDVIMRLLGVDPYQYAKLQFMKRTFNERLAMRRRWESANMQRGLIRLPSYLAAVWRQPWPASLRRAVLFELWDECAESGNKLMRDGGAQARSLIERFVARYLPPGSRDGYTVAELRWLNTRRTSRAAFAPYGGMRPHVMVARGGLQQPVSHTALMRLAASF